ncbi:MAG: hypothetical protein MK291_05405 [Planctomycetes bacterium]|nr:hypothetical protein [Planctomycetota bacterium]
MTASGVRLLRALLAVPLGVAFVMIGVQHFTRPEAFDAIVPSYLGWPRLWTLVSGAFEVLLGLGLCISRARPTSARLLFWLVILMSLANINMWWNDLEFDGTRLDQTGHVIRFSVQIVLLIALSWLSRGESARASKES